MITMTQSWGYNTDHPTLKGETCPCFSQSIIQIVQVRAGKVVLRVGLQLGLGVGLLPTC